MGVESNRPVDGTASDSLFGLPRHRARVLAVLRDDDAARALADGAVVEDGRPAAATAAPPATPARHFSDSDSSHDPTTLQ